MSATVDALLAVLDDAVLDALADKIADRVAERLPMGSSSRLLTAGELAAELGVDRRWVYEHQEQLGALRLGDGPKARVRFDSERAREALSCLGDKQPQAETASTDGPSRRPLRRRGTRNATGLPQPGSVLELRGRATGVRKVS